MDVASLIMAIDDAGYKCTLGEVYRTPEQAEMNARAGKGIVNSLHCKRLAIDINLFTTEGIYLTKSEDYKKFGEIWERYNPLNRWGGNFTGKLIDGNHFERKV
jgi:hypothetical protein